MATAFGLSFGMPAYDGLGGSGVVIPSADPLYANVALLCHFDAGNLQAACVDNSKYARVGIAATTGVGGACTQSTAQVKFGVSSLALATATAGSGAQFSGDVSAQLSPGTGDFTIEGWLYPTTLTGYPALYQCNGAHANRFLFSKYPDTNQLYVQAPTTGDLGPFNAGLTLNAWNHVAWSRTSGVSKMFVNGVQVASVADTANYQAGTTGFFLGTELGSYAAHFIDDIRVTIGVGRYTANFTPPAAAFPDTGPAGTDPDFALVKLLMHMEGGAFVDSSLAAQTFAAPVGTAALSSAQAKFGTQSVALVNNTDTIQTASAASLAFGGAAASWCLEFWVRFTSVASGIFFFVWTDGTQTLYFQFTSAGIFKARIGAQDLPGLTPVVVNQWYFVRVNKDTTSPGLNFFIDGVKQSGPFASANTMLSPAKVCVGGNAATSGANTQGRCYIDEVRLTLGSARTPSNNIVPTAAFPDS